MIGKLEKGFGQPDTIRALREACQLMEGALAGLEMQLADRGEACRRLEDQAAALLAERAQLRQEVDRLR